MKYLSKIVAITLIMVGLLTIFGTDRASADIVTCNDGSVHSNPTSDYACLGPGEGGVKSVAPNADQASKPGDICPDGFANAGQKIPPGKDGTWCNQADIAPIRVKNDCETGQGKPLDQTNCGIIHYLVIIINGLSALVGVVVVAMIIYSGIQYSSAGDDPQKVAAAKKKISNALLALVVFIFMYALLQWLIPGGLL